MKVNYTNPILHSEIPKKHLDDYFNESKPDMYVKDIEASINNSMGSLTQPKFSFHGSSTSVQPTDRGYSTI